ncbi:MAG: tripartite tricarboxylate transporter substrate binding protein [Pusillimonas sp.]
MIKSISIALAILAMSGASPAALAAGTFPDRPIRFVVPYPPGGGNDALARVMAQKLSENLDQTVIVDNKPGGTGMIAGNFVAKAAPDGYTVMIDQSSIVINPSLFSNIPFDIRTDLAPVTLAATVDNVLVVHPSVPAKDIKELIALAKSQPGRLNYASTGTGGPQHIAMEQFKSMAGVNIVHIPYKGGGPATMAVLSSEVQMEVIGISTALPHIKSGKLRAIAALGATRPSALPALVTATESGLEDYTSVVWFGIFAPGATPPPVIERLNAEFVKALEAPEVRAKMSELGFDVVASSSAAMAETIEKDLVRFDKVIREAGIKAD